MLASDLTDHQKTRLVQILRGDFEIGFVIPERLNLIKVNTVFSEVQVALVRVKFKRHGAIIPTSKNRFPRPPTPLTTPQLPITFSTKN